MNSVLATINQKLIPAMSLENADGRWSSTVRSSWLLRLWNAFVERCSSIFAGAATAGTWLQRISYFLVVLLFLILAAPQFANDKEGLAVLVVVACILRLAGTLLNGKERYKPSAIDGIVLLFFAMNVIASFGSHYPKESLFGLAKLFVYVLAYFLFTSSFQQAPKTRITVTLLALVAGALVVSLYGLYQYKIGVAPLATWEDPTIEDKATRVFSTLGNPNLLAGYLVPVIPISFALACMSAFARGLWRWFCVPLFGICGVITIATFLTGSRGAYIGLIFVALIVAQAVFSWLWRRQPKARLPLILALILTPVAAVAVLHFALPSFEHRFLSIFAGSEHSSNAYRMNVWRSSAQMFKDNWWLGVGTGNKAFRLAYGLYMRSSFDALGTYCVPLEVAVETGVVGLLIFLWLLVSCLARAHSRFWSTQDAMIRWLCIAGAGAIMGMMAHGMVDTVFYRPQVQFIFWLVISLLVALPAAGDISASDKSGS